jgi:ferritin-like metal-binding protein YciE
MDQNVLRMLDSMIVTTTDQETVARLTQHRGETEKHEQLLKARLEAMGAGTYAVAEVGAMLKGVGDQVRTDKPGKNGQDGYITEHVEIAAYELLERLAHRAGDPVTAQLARTIRRDEEAMAQWIAARWDKFLDLTLAEAGLRAAAGTSI